MLEVKTPLLFFPVSLLLLSIGNVHQSQAVEEITDVLASNYGHKNNLNKIGIKWQHFRKIQV